MVDNPPNTTELSAEMLQSLAAYAPAAIKAISATAPGTAQDTLAAQQAVAPGYAALQNQISGQYGPEAARIGVNLNDITQKGAAQTELDLARGPGDQLVNQALLEQHKLDPEYYKSRALVSDALNKYLTSYDPNKLTGSELEQINRGISGREGPLTPSALNTVKNAQTFGNAATQRWQNFGNAVAQGASMLPGFKSGLTGFEIATRRPLTSNVGTDRLSTPAAISSADAMANNFGFANNTLNQIGGLARGYQSKWKDFADINSQAAQSAQGYTSAVSNIAKMFG